jgi:molybdopterin molybdotransferase
MITVDEAMSLVLEHARPRPSQWVPLTESVDLVLAEDVASDVDSPPHDKAMVDGYAVRSADLANGAAALTVVEEVPAGAVPTRPLAASQATRIMTGAPIPDGADAVVMLERGTCQRDASGRELVRIADERFRPGQHIMRRGESMRCGETVLHRGKLLGPADIGLLAEVGRARVAAIPAPRVAVLATGNELVPADQRPAAGQIRNSNGPMLAAAIRRAGGVALDLGIARDAPDALREPISQGLQADVLVLAGGVSAGAFDLVPGMLAELGVRQVFHKVRLKPGKPIWFGTRPAEGPPGDAASASGAAAGETLVFGLPGNPVSSLVCFFLFVRLAMLRLRGHEPPARSPIRARLTAPFMHRGDRPTFYPARWSRQRDGVLEVTPLRWAGSADLRGFAQAEALIAFAAGERSYQTGDEVDVLPL